MNEPFLFVTDPFLLVANDTFQPKHGGDHQCVSHYFQKQRAAQLCLKVIRPIMTILTASYSLKDTVEYIRSVLGNFLGQQTRA